MYVCMYVFACNEIIFFNQTFIKIIFVFKIQNEIYVLLFRLLQRSVLKELMILAWKDYPWMYTARGHSIAVSWTMMESSITLSKGHTGCRLADSVTCIHY